MQFFLYLALSKKYGSYKKQQEFVCFVPINVIHQTSKNISEWNVQKIYVSSAKKVTMWIVSSNIYVWV